MHFFIKADIYKRINFGLIIAPVVFRQVLRTVFAGFLTPA